MVVSCVTHYVCTYLWATPDTGLRFDLDVCLSCECMPAGVMVTSHDDSGAFPGVLGKQDDYMIFC
jgi:hypothetical protein